MTTNTEPEPDTEAEQYPDIDTVAPRESFKLVLGDNVQTDLLLYLMEQRGAVTAADLVADLNHDPDDIADEIQKLHQFGAIECPHHGMYRLTYKPVGASLRDVVDTASDTIRENRGQAPLSEVVARD